MAEGLAAGDDHDLMAGSRQGLDAVDRIRNRVEGYEKVRFPFTRPSASSAIGFRHEERGLRR